MWRLALLAGAAVITGPAFGANITWNAGTGDWFTPGNWLPTQVPGANDTAIINNGGTAQAGSDATVFTLAAGATSGAGESVSGTAALGGTLTLAGELIVGRAFFAPGATAVGTVTVGTLATQAPQFPPNSAFWSIGVGQGGSGSGSVTAASVDTSAQALAALNVGFANQGGTGIGSLSVGNGDLDVANTVFVGVASGQSGVAAEGTLALGGSLSAQGTNRFLRVGAVDGGFFDAGAGSAVGSIEAGGIAGFRFVTIGTSSLYNGAVAPVTASGTATVGAGGIVNATDPGGTLQIGVATGQPVNSAVIGPGAAVTGSAAVGGDITGYATVDIGRVVNTGQASGSLDLANGTLTTATLRIGTVQGSDGAFTIADGAAAADGRLSVTDGAVVIAQPQPQFLGTATVGGIATPDPTVAATARGQLDLTRSSLTGGLLTVGIRTDGLLVLGTLGGEGTVTAQDASTIDVNVLSVGVNGGVGVLTLDGSTLAVRAHPTIGNFGSMSVGAFDGSGLVTATSSSLTIESVLRIAQDSNSATPSLGRMALADSTLGVGRFVTIGSYGTGSRGELSLVNSTATVGDFLRLGASANNGELFGEAMLEVRSSLLTIGGDLFMDAFAAPGIETIFGIDGLARGLGGYGAIDAETATLAGLVTVDFAGLGAPPGVGDWVFDLIVTGTGIFRDFDDVQFLGLADGYSVSFYGIVEQSEGAIWRVILTQADPNQVPEPAAIALLLFGLAGLALARRRV